MLAKRSSLGRLDQVAYRAQQLTFLINASVLQETARILSRTPRPKVAPGAVALLRQRVRELLDRDLENVRRGLYPKELLFQLPTRDYARLLPRLVLDTPAILRRKRRGAYKDIPPVDKQRFPAYYRRTFHWQTDGYLSAHSAELYDLGVELLFRGTADVMRRQVIPPITRFLAEERLTPGQVRLLDVGCGTGRFLHQLAAAHPGVRIHGVDLSPFYIEAARRLLAAVSEVSLAVENAEALPYADAMFDIVTSIYLFHELPRNARRNVIAEMWRVLRPGGLLVIEDSCQPADSPELVSVLADFPAEFHEPFYQDYLEDDLAACLRERGFTVASVEPVLVAKVVVARKPG